MGRGVWDKPAPTPPPESDRDPAVAEGGPEGAGAQHRQDFCLLQRIEK